MKRILFFLLLMVLTLGGSYSAIKVRNLSQKYYIHANIGGKWVLYIEPGGESGSVSVPPDSQIPCYVIIAPGQDKEGRIDTTLSTEGSPPPFGCEYVEPSTVWKVNVDSL